MADKRGERQQVGSGGPFEESAAYSRAVRVGNVVYVAGTAAYRDGKPFAPGDAAAQTRYILEVIDIALRQAGAAMTDVVRYRVFVTAFDVWQDVAAEMGRVFAEIRPAGTLVGVSWLVDPDLLVEIEVDAVIGEDGESAPEG